MAVFNIPYTRILPFLKRAIGYANIDPADFVIDVYPNLDANGDQCRITCKKCRTYEEQLACDWSDDFKLDNMVDMVVKFSKSHEHLVSVDVEEEFAGRKFRY
jgi:hypothetical protein